MYAGTSRSVVVPEELAMKRSHRRLLPAPLPQANAEASPASSITRRRSAIRVACNRCRDKKTMCDGNRPSCNRCSQRNNVCIYDTGDREETRRVARERHLAGLQLQLKQHEDIIQHLRSAPEHDALAIIRRLKSTPDLEAVLSSVRNSMPRKRPSDIEAARATLPFTQSGLEFELAVLHGNAYPALADIDTSAINVSSIFERRTSSVLPYAATNALLENYETLAVKSVDANSVKGLIRGPPSPLRGTSSRSSSPLSGPYKDRVFCDPRLRQVRFKYWTRVPLSDEFAASLLSVYFENEHAIIGTFDMPLFLDDLVDGRFEFCSSFLVSSLLCLASLCFSSLDSRAFPLAVAFLDEAQSLWKAERSSNSIVNLAALITLGVATMMHGKDEISLELFADGRYMAERMSLIGVRHTPHLYQQFHQLPPKTLRASAHAAWSCYTCVHASYYKGKPIEFPPLLPIPGLSSSAYPYDWPVYPEPEYLGHTFIEWCKLWTIAQEIQAMYSGNDAVPLQDVVPYAFVESKYQKLLAWADNLYQGMRRQDQKFPHVSVIHSPKTVFDASLRQLQRILLDYTSNYDPRFYNFIINGAVLHVLDVTLHNRDTLGWRLNITLGMGWIREIYVRFAVIGKVAQAYMAIGLDTGMISNEEAVEFMEALQLRGRHQNLADVAVSCIVDFGVAMSSQNDELEGAAPQEPPNHRSPSIFQDVELLAWDRHVTDCYAHRGSGCHFVRSYVELASINAEFRWSAIQGFHSTLPRAARLPVEQAWALMRFHFDYVFWHHNAFHVPTFLAQPETFWTSGTDSLWTALNAESFNVSLKVDQQAVRAHSQAMLQTLYDCNFLEQLSYASNIWYNDLIAGRATLMPPLLDGLGPLKKCRPLRDVYKHIISTDETLRNMISDVPVFLLHESPEDDPSHVWLPLARKSLAITAAVKIPLIHRAVLLQSFQSNVFQRTRRTCVAAAMTILREHGRLPGEVSVSIWTHSAFCKMATMVVGLELVYRSNHTDAEARNLRQSILQTSVRLRNWKFDIIAELGAVLIDTILTTQEELVVKTTPTNFPSSAVTELQQDTINEMIKSHQFMARFLILSSDDSSCSDPKAAGLHDEGSSGLPYHAGGPRVSRRIRDRHRLLVGPSLFWQW
ncbi:nitrate assimilation regulatory protein nira [Paramyrothecium foliicola]|nr:nitrate assimilation regulatory protein nira [Paramyrothecium foliicola]